MVLLQFWLRFDRALGAPAGLSGNLDGLGCRHKPRGFKEHLLLSESDFSFDHPTS